ncbi:MAG TPA: AsmA family protein [Steroidobacteraceae bacterium]|jgi:AsmA protein|nr:AsmA family protein [Steroidobacteraceae bacterium]
MDRSGSGYGRAVRIVGILVGAVLAAVIALLLAVKLFVNPANYRGRIEQAVQHSTGRPLRLSGDLKLSVFPWLALELGPATLGNPPGFGTEPFATVQHVAFRVRLLPLLGKRLEIGRVEIDGLDLRLQKNAAGKGNWENFGQADAAAGAPAPSVAVTPKNENASGAGMLQQVDGVIVRDGRFSYQGTVVDHIDLTAGNFASRTSMPIKLTATIHPKDTAAGMAVEFASPGIGLDLDAQTLEVPAFSASLDKALLTGSIRGTKILDAAALTGFFKLQPMSPRDLMSAWGTPPPAMRDPKALSSFAADGEFSYGDHQAAATRLDLRLDDSRLQGNVAITDLDTDALAFDLTLDRIDIDRYLSPAPSGPPAGAPAAVTPAVTPGSANDRGDSGAAFKKLDVKGALSLGNLTVAGLNLTQVKAEVAAQNGVMQVAPMTASLYDGSATGDITLTGGTTLALHLRQSLKNVDIASLLADLAHTRRVSGHGDVTIDLSARGWNAADITGSLDGHASASLTDGAVEGVDLWFEINRAMALIQSQPMPPGSSSGRTRFDTFRASADLGNGVATTRDLNIVSQNLRVAGQGTSNLVTDQINYGVTATVLKELPSATNASGTKLADIPLTITGTMSHPQVRPDLEGMAKARVQHELEQHQDVIKQKVQDALKGLLK